MKKITMTLQQVESWAVQYTGDRTGIYFDGVDGLYVPDELFDAVMAVDTSAPAYLDIIKDRLKKKVDEQAETERLRYITPGAGQAMTYQQKMEEVRALTQDAEPDEANYPLLSAEVGITAPTLTEVATVVLAAFQQWQQVGALIEGTRLSAKAAIDATETEADAQAAFDGVGWPSLDV